VMSRSSAVIGLIIVSILGAQSSFAMNTNEKVSEISELKNNILKSSSKRRKVMAALYALDEKLAKVVSKKEHIESEVKEFEAKLLQLSASKSKVTEDFEIEKEQIRKRLVSLYKFGSQGLSRVLFSDMSITDRNTIVKVLSTLAKEDVKSLGRFRKYGSSLVAKTEKMRQKKRALASRLKALKSSEANLKKREELQRKLVKASKKLVADDLAKLAKVKETLDLNQFSEKEQSLLQKLLVPALYEQKGRLGWPILGSVSKPFGKISLNPDTTYFNHKGIFINSSVGSSAHSVSEGRVVFSGSVPGIGNTVIVDHGFNYYTVYGNLDKVKVKEGVYIRQGIEIGTVGFDHFWSQAGLYFDLRHYTQSEDPLKWLGSRDLASEREYHNKRSAL
jgi:septal ring factor EnvC (AmiA/AmiB activator)